jgi:hypothetical protein
MDATASNFSNRSNAKRAGEKMIARGTAPAVDYGIKPSDDGRFEIVWKTALTTGEVEAEIATATGEADKTGTESFRGTEETHFTGVTLPETEIAVAATLAHGPALSELAPITAPENNWPDGTRVMVPKGKSWSEATITRRLNADYWRVRSPVGGSGVEADIRAYDAERDAGPARQPRRARQASTAPRKGSRSSYAIDPAAIAAGTLPDKAPIVTSKANQLYQKHRLLVHTRAGEWGCGARLQSHWQQQLMVARYRQDLLDLHAASGAAQ